jgi:hypothetical protein
MCLILTSARRWSILGAVLVGSHVRFLLTADDDPGESTAGHIPRFALSLVLVRQQRTTEFQPRAVPRKRTQLCAPAPILRGQGPRSCLAPPLLRLVFTLPYSPARYAVRVTCAATSYAAMTGAPARAAAALGSAIACRNNVSPASRSASVS